MTYACHGERIGSRAADNAPVEIKPPRLNFARRCIYCLERDCDSPNCQASYERSRWAICPECDGREGDEITSEQCQWCTFGVVEIAPARVTSVEGLAELR